MGALGVSILSFLLINVVMFSCYSEDPSKTIRVHSGQTKKPTSHPVASALKICIRSKPERSS